jgi:hypothetical protein
LTLQGASSLPPLSAREKRQLKAAAALRSEYRELCVHRAVPLLFQSHQYLLAGLFIAEALFFAENNSVTLTQIRCGPV